MKRFALLLLSLMLLSLNGLAQAGSNDGHNHASGAKYELVTPPQPTETGDKIEVLELFWYGCPHCYRFEPHLNKWLKKGPANVTFRRMPAIFRSSWEIHARAYYTAEALGVVDKIHAPLFHAMHKERKKMKTEKVLREFFIKHGVSEKDFNETFRSFSVDAKVRRARVMSRRYGIHGVPSIVVNGKYRVGGDLAGGTPNMMKVVDSLIKKETGGNAK